SPRAALDEAGATTVIVSPSEGTLQAMEGDWEHADTFTVDVPVAEASVEDFDVLVLPGGTLNADALRLAENAVELVKAFFSADKPVAAICHRSEERRVGKARSGRRRRWPPSCDRER